ncbi:MAG: DJ-1/PfpI family protein [Spirochaetota bacterium]
MKVYLYLLNTLADWEIGFITAELTSKRYFKNKNEECALIKIGNTRESIKTMGGIAITPDMTIEKINLNKEDILILPGADTWLNKENENALFIAKNYIERDYNVAAICGATIGLGRIGALNNKMHTSNSKEYLKMICPDYSGEGKYQEKPAVCDQNLITATGLAPLEFTFEIIQQLKIFKKETLSAWYSLYITKEAKYYFELMNSLKN